MRLTQTGIVLSEHSSQSQSRGNYYCHNRHQLDEDVQTRPTGIFERIANSIAHDSRLVCIRTLTAKKAGLDVLLGIVPGTSRIGHENGHTETTSQRTDQESQNSTHAQQEACDNRGNQSQQ